MKKTYISYQVDASGVVISKVIANKPVIHTGDGIVLDKEHAPLERLVGKHAYDKEKRELYQFKTTVDENGVESIVFANGKPEYKPFTKKIQVD